MENGTFMVNVSLSEYSNGIAALAKIEALRRFTEISKYGPSKAEIACILGFELPVKENQNE